MKKVVIIWALIICFSVAPIANANTFGNNSLVTIPTADILMQQNLNLSYQMVGDEDLVVINYGFNDKVQVGTNLEWKQGIEGEGEIYPSVKVKLLEENKEFQPTLSLGFIDRNYYLVASKTTSIAGIRAHAGFFNFVDADNEGFIGISRVLNPVTISTGDNDFQLPVTTVMAEYNQGLNLGAKFGFTEHISADLGAVNIIDEAEFAVGINFKNKF